jgi:hypothetical protein
MRNKLFLPIAALCCCLALVAGACSKDDDAAEGKRAEATTTTAAEESTTTTEAEAEAGDDTLVDVIVADDELSEFAGWITLAGLDETLSAAPTRSSPRPTRRSTPSRRRP